MEYNLKETVNSTLLSLEHYKQALKAVPPPTDITDARIALAYMIFLVDQLILLIKLVDEREKERLSNLTINVTLTKEAQFLRELCLRLATSEKKPNITINILETRSAIDDWCDIDYKCLGAYMLSSLAYGMLTMGNALSTKSEEDQSYQISLKDFVAIQNQLVGELKQEISNLEKRWNKVKAIAGKIAALLFFTAIIMLIATQSYTLPYIIIMATFAAVGILAPFIGLSFKSGQPSLLDSIFFNPSAKQIQRCIEDIKEPWFEGKNECKVLATTSKSSDNSVLISGIFAEKSKSLQRSLQCLVEEKYQTISIPAC